MSSNKFFIILRLSLSVKYQYKIWQKFLKSKTEKIFGTLKLKRYCLKILIANSSLSETLLENKNFYFQQKFWITVPLTCICRGRSILEKSGVELILNELKSQKIDFLTFKLIQKQNKLKHFFIFKLAFRGLLIVGF